MLYPRDNRPRVSANLHSLGLQNDITVTPPLGSSNFLAQLASDKEDLTSGALKGLGDLTVINTGHPWFWVLFGGLVFFAFNKA